MQVPVRLQQTLSIRLCVCVTNILVGHAFLSVFQAGWANTIVRGFVLHISIQSPLNICVPMIIFPRHLRSVSFSFSWKSVRKWDSASLQSALHSVITLFLLHHYSLSNLSLLITMSLFYLHYVAILSLLCYYSVCQGPTLSLLCRKAAITQSLSLSR